MFQAGGGKQFFHGGLSPQELLIPVIVVDLEPAREPQKLDVDVTIAGGTITTGVFAASVEFHGDLFTTEITVRVVARGRGRQRPVARVVSGDGFDPATGSVTIAGRATPPVLTFQVTANLDRDSQVDIAGPRRSHRRPSRRNRGGRRGHDRGGGRPGDRHRMRRTSIDSAQRRVRWPCRPQGPRPPGQGRRERACLRP